MNVAEAKTGRDPSSDPTKLSPQPQDCFTCRLIGSTALGAVGIYALNQSRRHQPGSPLGKRIMAAVGVCE